MVGLLLSMMGDLDPMSLTKQDSDQLTAVTCQRSKLQYSRVELELPPTRNVCKTTAKQT